MTNVITKMALEPALKKLFACISSDMAEKFLEVLLDVMKVVFMLDGDFRRNIDGFEGRYLFRSADRSIDVSACFEDDKLHVSEEEVANPHVTVIFKDGKALMSFLLTENPDILGSMLRQEVTPEGNLNYLYKFAYMARRLQLMATGQT